MRFEFATTSRIVFGQGTLKEAAPIAASFGRRALIVVGSTADQAMELIDQLKPQSVAAATIPPMSQETRMGFDTVLQILIQGLNMGLIYALAALGISLIWSASGLFNFAQGDLLTVGGYVMLSTFAHLALPYPLAFALTIGLMGLAGYLLSRGYFFPMLAQGMHPDIIIIGSVSLMVLLQNGIMITWGTQAQRFSSPLGEAPLHVGQVLIMPYYVTILSSSSCWWRSFNSSLRGPSSASRCAPWRSGRSPPLSWACALS